MGMWANVRTSHDRRNALHYVNSLNKDILPTEGNKILAVCGRRPKNGWEIRKQVNEKCSRCLRIIGNNI